MIDMSLSLILTEAAIFLLLLIVLNKILIKPVVSHIDARNKSIKDGLDSVNQNSHEIDDLRQEAENIVKNAKIEASELRNERLSATRESIQKKIDEKKVVIENELKQFNIELGIQRVDLKNSLLGQAPLFKESLRTKLISSSANQG